MTAVSLARLRDCLQRYASTIPELADVAGQLQTLSERDTLIKLYDIRGLPVAGTGDVAR